VTILKSSLLRRVSNSIRLSRRKRAATVDLTANGFVWSQGRKSVELSWDDISQIDAGVRDYITFDSFYIVIFAREKKLVIEEPSALARDARTLAAASVRAVASGALRDLVETRLSDAALSADAGI
jgi:hypothetical protein